MPRLDEWSLAVSPVLVLTSTSGANVPVTCAEGHGLVIWSLTLENGEERRGEASFDKLRLLERRLVGARSFERRSLELEVDLPFGYHRLLLTPSQAQSTLIVSPGKCWLPESIEKGRKVWGVAAQLYLLKSRTNWGLGDFTDLSRLTKALVDCGADAIGLNPLHAMFPDNPEHASPYSPASRLLLNVLNIDVSTVANRYECVHALDHIQSRNFQRELPICRESDLIDYTRVTSLKMMTLEMIFTEASRRPSLQAWEAFERISSKADETHKRHCLFLALRAHFASQDSALADWRTWPTNFQSPDSDAVKQYAQEDPARVLFQLWLQHEADEQLAAAARAAESMAVGLYRDLAVGADPSGAETWNNQAAVIADAHVGAPPDIYNPPGQNWGLPPFHPTALREEGYRSFIDLLRANMRHAGGLRIDHVMALQHLYLIPRGSSAAQGAYVRYPMEDLIAILALESVRNQCVIVGEDLGTVPEGFRERMTEARILSYRVLFFEKENSEFIAPDRYPVLSLAVAGSHDLPTLKAWMAGNDIALKASLGLFPDKTLFEEATAERIRDRDALIEALKQQKLNVQAALPAVSFADAAHTFLARSAPGIAMVQIDDIEGETAPVNVPTTSTEHPNWRRRLSVSLEELEQGSRLGTLARLLNDARSVAGQSPPSADKARRKH